MNQFTNNRNKLEEYMEENSVLVVFAGQAPYKRGDEKYPFSPDRNFYYLTGIDRENCILIMSYTAKGMETKLYIPRDNGYLAKWVGANMTEEEAEEISGITDISFVDLFQSDFAEFVFRYNIDTLWLDLENRDWNAQPTVALTFAKEVQGKYPSLILENSYPIFSDLRLIKDEWELERMQRAMKITEEGFLAMMSLVRPGMKEYEIEAYFDFVLTKRGVRQKAFQTIAASGERGCILHYTENNQTAQDGDLILVDAGAQVEWYNGDITRTFPVNGKFSDQQKLVYNIVLEGHRKVVETIQVGVPFTRLNEVLREHYVEALTGIGLITEPEELNKYYYHGVSHYLGAETHDIGRYMDRELEAGMVLTVEPGLYIEEWNIGIRIEDDVLVTEDGAEIMTIDMIRTVDEIESYMAKGRMK